MHEDEIPTDAALVQRLIATQFPQWAELAIDPVSSSGTDNALFRLGADLVVRFPRIQWAAAHADKEYEWLPRLAPHLPLPVPAPVAKGEPDADYPWSWTVCPWLAGENPATDALPDAAAVAHDLVQFVDVLHRIDTQGGPPAGEANVYRGVPLAQRDSGTRAAIQHLDGEFDPDAVTAAWETALAAAEWTGAPVWVHGDLAPGNLLCANGQLTAVIDFGCLGVGDPAVDLIVAWNLFAGDARDAFRAAMRVDNATWARGRGWALSIALIQFPYYRDTNPALAASSRFVINAVLGDQR